MIYSVKEYSDCFLFAGRQKSPKTIIRMGLKKQLPTNHRFFKVGKTYAIEVKNDFKEN